MGGLCCCPRTDEFDHSYCSFLPFFFHHFLSRCEPVFHSVESRSAFTSPGGNSLAWSDVCENESSALSLSTSPSFDADHRYSRDGLVSRKSMPHFQQDSHPAPLTDLKWNGVDNKLGYGLAYVEPTSEDEDLCPTCLEEYTSENPKITTRCSHHFHLGCIYEWLERSESCPVCGKEMEFRESP